MSTTGPSHPPPSQTGSPRQPRPPDPPEAPLPLEKHQRPNFPTHLAEPIGYERMAVLNVPVSTIILYYIILYIIYYIVYYILYYIILHYIYIYVIYYILYHRYIILYCIIYMLYYIYNLLFPGSCMTKYDSRQAA